MIIFYLATPEENLTCSLPWRKSLAHSLCLCLSVCLSHSFAPSLSRALSDVQSTYELSTLFCLCSRSPYICMWCNREISSKMVSAQVFFCWLFYILATSKVISGRIMTDDSAQPWRLDSAASLGDQGSSIVTWYPTQLHSTDTEPTSPCPILIMPSAWLCSNKYQFLSQWFNIGSNLWGMNGKKCCFESWSGYMSLGYYSPLKNFL